MIQIYTGNGKGKTTAALGCALRAAGHGFKVLVIQFMKGEINYGELTACTYLPNFTIEQYGRPDFVNPARPTKKDVQLAHKALKRAIEAIKSHSYDFVILDEVNVAVSFGLLDAGAVVQLMKETPRDVELILTGRTMPREFAPHADLISEIREIKHPFHKGVRARKGIEY